MNDWTLPPGFEENVRQSFGVPETRPEFVEQLYGNLMRRAEAKSRKARFSFGIKPAWWIAFAILSLLIVTILVVGPQNVYAAVQRLFGYIPGVGLVEQNSSIRVLAEPVNLTRDGITISVTSATLTEDRTHVEYRIFGVPGAAYPDREDLVGCMQPDYLLLADGSRLGFGPAGDFLPVPAGIDEALLVIPCIANTLPGTIPIDWHLPLRFVPAPAELTVMPVIESLPSATPTVAADTPTPEPNPLVITKVLDIGDRFVLMGEFGYSAARDASLPEGSWWAIKQISIFGADGNEVPQTYSNDLQQPTPSGPDRETWLYQLEKNFIPPLTIQYTGEIISPVGNNEQAEFKFDAGPNPQDGGVWSVDKDFSLGGYNIRLVSIESGPNGYIFYFKGDPGASSQAIKVDILGYTPNCGGGGGGGLFSEEFSRDVCYAGLPGGPDFPHGEVTAVIHFQPLTRTGKVFQVQWSPDELQTGVFATLTPQPGVCLGPGGLARLDPLPADLANGMALTYDKLNDKNDWGMVLTSLDGSRRRVLAPGGNGGALAWDGSRVAYSAFDGLRVMDLATNAEQSLVGVNGFNLQWSPDGKQIAYVGGEDSSIFIANADGSQARRISDLSRELLTGWSADCGRLYFVAAFTGGAAWKVYEFNLADNTSRELFTIENGTPKALNPVLSADGAWIAYRGRDNSSVFVVRSDGRDMHLLMDNVGARSLIWSRSGWLGASIGKPDSGETLTVVIRPETCQTYLLAGVNGDLEGLWFP